MSDQILVDTGAIVGYLNAYDQWHKEAVHLFERLPKPFYTCEAVVTEACFRVRSSRTGAKRVQDLLDEGILEIKFDLSEEHGDVFLLMEKYHYVPMSLADACLVRMSEVYCLPVFTFDGDFRFYRGLGKQTIPLIGLDATLS